MTVFALIPLLPLLGFFVIAFGGNRLGEVSHRIGIPAVGLSAALSFVAFYYVAVAGPISIPLYTLIDVGAVSVAVDLYIDQLTVLLLLLVTVGSFVVHVYSSSYMIGDPRYRRFFAVIGLFTFAMVLLVMSNNLLVTYMCWEVMGICSYLLISHWAHRESAAKAATKAFLVNAVADVGLGFGVIFTLATYGTLNIQEILAAVPSMAGSDINLLGWLGFEWLIERNTLITFCLLSGALGKSAQFPLHIWLPFAMEAPTPISALIHAATMVNAGPFLLARMSPLVLSAPSAMAVIAIVGMTTAVYGGLVALTQSDIKKSLAYSTISHIGFMIFACGVGAFVAAIFHLLAHGFLKGFLFLSTGNALESASAHGHAKSSGRVSGSLAAGALLLALIPAVVIFSGPYEQMWTAHQTPAAQVAFFFLALATVFLTGMYIFRAVSSLFGHQVGNSGVLPNLFAPAYLAGVGVLVAAVGCLLVFVWTWFAAFLGPALGAQPPLAAGPAFSPWLVAALLAAVAGWGFARQFQPSPTFAGAWTKMAYVALLNRLYVDEIFDAFVVGPFIRFCDWLQGTIETLGLDNLIQTTARVVMVLSNWLWTVLEVRGLDRGLGGGADSSVALSRWLWRVVDLRGDAMVEGLGRASDENGEMLQRIEPRTLQHHLLVVVFWLMLAIALSYWLIL
ncbi:MAG: NADH-quinone oxidoreductase subunit L [Acidobacteria bacterium]|nr:NADH-quinone oxidoreductase subunit L [Acidobacteriota bacterium]